ncbi:MAG: hypothetical protein II567_03285 [Candidatus Riflebacteria bacterium]|jgi:hypothetical protein|nr:hypothetical protein [Candidatus Riflebacteria bacterium]
MGFNPLKNKVALSSQTTIILTIILYLLGYQNACFIVLILGIIWTGLFYFINDLKKRSRISREKEFQKYVKRTGDSFLDHFDDPLRDGLAMYCFSYMEKPYYYNVIEKTYQEDETKVYIGELEWEEQLELSLSKRSESTFATRAVDQTDGQHKGFRNYATMCVLYDNRFRLPNFDLTNETLAKKTAEVLKINKTQDIDFDEDKAFSDAWWLCTNETMIVRDLFDKNVRSNFMKYLNRNYQITGQGNMLIIITEKPLLANEYPRVINDIRLIQRFLKNNKKFYNEPKNRY